MRDPIDIEHRFVEFVPRELEEGVLFISIEYATASHKCFCGCGERVVTPLSPTDWQLLFDGKTVSLYPSIGSWRLPCRSHYWIRRGRVEWARAWSQDEIDSGRRYDRYLKDLYYGERSRPGARGTDEAMPPGRGYTPTRFASDTDEE